MDSLVLNSILTLAGIGFIAASVLFIGSKKFYVYEDPKIDEVEELLPSANCGGCGFPGCRNFAEAIVKNNSLDGLDCPVGGNDCMAAVASVMGLEAVAKEPMVAVLKCNGTRENTPPKVTYSAAKSCVLAHGNFAGEGGCQYGCVGLGDCCDVCDFDALEMDEKTGLPIVDVEKCTACGACITACPRLLFELRPKGKDNKRVYVACMNKERGPAAKKNCKVACIGCTRCTKIEGVEGEVKIQSFLSYISNNVDPEKCGPELVGCCPTSSIIGTNIIPVKPAPKAKPTPKPQTT